MATEDMRVLLHQILEELHALCLKENSDFFTHDFPIDLTYNSDSLGYTFSVDTLPNGSGGEVTDLIPVFLRYQALTDDPEDDRWYRCNVSKLTTFTQDASPREVTAAMLGNSWQGLTSPNFKFNVQSDFITEHRWRVYCRLFPNQILDYTDTFPFPGEHTSLIEHMLALKSIVLVNDDSPGWRSFVPGQTQMLMAQVKMGKDSLIDWLNKDVENRIITNQPYNYQTNNKLLGPQRGRYRTPW